VAECTRLILVKDGFGGDLGALDQWADEHRKGTRILQWFGPPERKTLRPLWCCIDCRSLMKHELESKVEPCELVIMF
jgi:hypothetical protein